MKATLLASFPHAEKGGSTLLASPPAVVAIVALALAASASAEHACYGRAPIMQEVAGFYVVVEEVLGQPNGHGYVYSVWIYMETNGEPGLQRGSCTFWGADSSCLFGRDPCVESWNPDTLVYPL